jgi:hypothetical protein
MNQAVAEKEFVMLTARVGMFLGVVAAAYLFVAGAQGGECKDCKNCERHHGRFDLGFNFDYESDGTATVVECEFAVSGEMPSPAEVAEPTVLPPCGIKSEQFEPYDIDVLQLSEPKLTAGRHCTVEVVRGRHTREIIGTIRKVTPEWLVIETEVERSKSENHSTPILSDIPYLNRLFRNVGVARWTEKHESWIPREAILKVTTPEDANSPSQERDDADKGCQDGSEEPNNPSDERQVFSFFIATER